MLVVLVLVLHVVAELFISIGAPHPTPPSIADLLEMTPFPPRASSTQETGSLEGRKASQCTTLRRQGLAQLHCRIKAGLVHAFHVSQENFGVLFMLFNKPETQMSR